MFLDLIFISLSPRRRQASQNVLCIATCKFVGARKTATPSKRKISAMDPDEYDENYRKEEIIELNVRMDELKEEIYMIQRQTVVRSEDYPFIDGHTRPSIDTSHTPFRGNLVTVKLLEDKLDEINFSQDLLKEDIPQRLEDIVEATHARLRMQQGSTIFSSNIVVIY
ncbi:hypothetical protein HID58_022561 [Brassica napus]|uniref:Uncharacterized protein n=1 Tax=Brassica napus TaxID=3708 RepID=A0ABQ8CZL4_BRANA|nr:hypothetical protein HID58_022561 [Brassica napus]